MLILNDLHLGVQRKSGVTPASQEALRNYLFDSLRKALDQTNEKTVMILGDLFDQFEVSPRDWLESYKILSVRSHVQHGTINLILVAGNHDISERGNKVSSFQVLCEVLSSERSVQVIGINQWAQVPGGIALAHCSNQEIFNMKLKEIAEKNSFSRFLFLHANFDNDFAAQSDHSLNVSREQAKTLIGVGFTLVFAHEHQARHPMEGVVVLGNQWPSSISDCLSNDSKFSHSTEPHTILLTDATWHRNSDKGYAEVDWRDLDLNCTAKFIRVSGEASANEAAEVVNAIAKFRSKHHAFVISNAVKVDGIVQDEELPATLDAVKGFDCYSFIDERLDPEERIVVNKLKERIEAP